MSKVNGGKRQGRDFEEAVYRFMKTLGPDATVRLDHKVPDKDSGTLRQADVWITTRLFGVPLSILVSCKDYKRRLYALDVDTFHAEVRALSANTGVLYARTGYSRAAVDKARKLGVSLCRLYQNQPAELPSVLIFESYLCQSQIVLSEVQLTGPLAGLSTWDELFDSPISGPNEERTILDAIQAAFHQGERASIAARDAKTVMPPAWQETLALPAGSSLKVAGRWRCFCGRAEAQLLNGSYCLNDLSYLGSQSTPSIDMHSVHPGAGWKEIPTAPNLQGRNTVVAIRCTGDVKSALRRHFAGTAITRAG